MPRLDALLWDVDGTLAETERDGHRVAFNQAFEVCGLPWRWDEARYGELLRVTGGKERLHHDIDARADAPRDPVERARLVDELHATKNVFYAEIVGQGRIALRKGVRELIDECRDRGVRAGIVTTTSRGNVDALLRAHLGERWAGGFAVVLCGEDVAHKKPSPEAYLRALRELRIGPLQAIAIEDSPAGATAARIAGVPVVVARSAYFAEAAVEGAIAVGPGLGTREGWTPALRREPAPAGRVRLDDVLAWRARGQ